MVLGLTVASSTLVVDSVSPVTYGPDPDVAAGVDDVEVQPAGCACGSQADV